MSTTFLAVTGIILVIGACALAALWPTRTVTQTRCFCPTCRRDLIAGDSYVGLSDEILTPAGDRAETYRCARCGTFSAWDFDMFPTPTIISFNVKEGTPGGA